LVLIIPIYIVLWLMFMYLLFYNEKYITKAKEQVCWSRQDCGDSFSFACCTRVSLISFVDHQGKDTMNVLNHTALQRRKPATTAMY